MRLQWAVVLLWLGVAVTLATTATAPEAEEAWHEDGDGTNNYSRLSQVSQMTEEEHAEGVVIRDDPKMDREAAAAAITKNLDTTVSPCEDFYQHSCGGWIKKFQLPDDHSEWTRSFDMIARRVKTTCKDILTGKTHVPENVVPSVLLEKLKTFYSVCNNDDALEKMGLDPVKKSLQKYIPLIKDTKSFMQVLANLGELGQDKLFSFGIGTDPKKPLEHITNLGQGGLGLPDKSYYSKKEHADLVKTKYHPLITQTLSSVLPVGSLQNKAELTEAVYDFEKSLSDITVDRTDLRDPIKTYHKYSKDQLYELAPYLKFYFDARKDNKKFWAKSPLLYLTTPTFFSGLDKLLKKTKPETLQAYLTWHMTTSGMGQLSDKTSLPLFKFYAQDISGAKERTPRWKRCYGEASSMLSEIMGRAYVGVAFRGTAKSKAQSLIRMIMSSFRGSLKELDWIDDKTRGKALTKLSALVDMVGFPDKWRTYKKAKMTQNHYENMDILSVVSNDHNLAKLGAPVDKREWGMSPSEVNAYYDPETNRIVFPAAILQEPFFNKDQPMAMNFGGIGLVMGHELTHGFDDQGRLYGPDGALKSWWEPATAKKFKAKVGCVVKQYSEFEIPGTPPVHVNGKLSLGENLADNGGMAISHHAYTLWAKQQPGGVEGQKAGRFSGDQLYFYGFSQAWCTKMRSHKAERLQVVTDPHSPSEFRVNGAVANSPAFAKAFGCKVGSKLNPGPEKRCLVWSQETLMQDTGKGALPADLFKAWKNAANGVHVKEAWKKAATAEHVKKQWSDAATGKHLKKGWADAAAGKHWPVNGGGGAKP